MASRRAAAAPAALIVIAVMLLGVAGCSDSAPATSDTVTGTPTTPAGEPFALPTSSWRPGQGAELALLQGTLRRRGDCLVVGPGRGTLVIWPAGFTGRRLPDGSVQVLNPEGQLATAVGDEVSLGGGAGPLPTEWASCRAADAFSVQQELP